MDKISVIYYIITLRVALWPSLLLHHCTRLKCHCRSLCIVNL